VVQVNGRISSFEHDSSKVEAQRQDVMVELEEKQRSLAKQADTFDERTKELAKIIDQVKAGKPVCSFIQIQFVGMLKKSTVNTIQYAVN